MPAAASRIERCSFSISVPADRGAARARRVIGVMLAVQSYCLHSAVARIPAALVLLDFNAFPFLLPLISWASGGERLSRRAVVAMPLAFAALALDVVGRLEEVAGRWREIGEGVSYALAAGLTLAASARAPILRLPPSISRSVSMPSRPPRRRH